MSSHEYIQKKNSQQSAPSTNNDILKSRPFAPKVQEAAPKESISVEQIEAAQQFGYNAVSLKTFAPGAEVQSDSQKEAEIQIDSQKLGAGAASETPPLAPTIQPQCDECSASEKEEKVEKKPTETIQAKAQTSDISIDNFQENPFNPKGEDGETEIWQEKEHENLSANILLNNEPSESELSITETKPNRKRAKKNPTLAPTTPADRVAPATITENKPAPEVANPTETILTKTQKSNPGITANFSQNRPSGINRHNFSIPPQTILPKIPNKSGSNLSDSNQFLTNRKSQVQRLNLSNQPYQSQVKSADLTQIIGTNPRFNKKQIQRKTEAKSSEKSQIGQEIQILFVRQLQREPLSSPPTPTPTSRAKINPAPPGFLSSNKQEPIQLKEETAKTGKETLIPKQFPNADNQFPIISHQSLLINSTNPSIQRDILGIPTSIDEAKSKILTPVAQLATRIPGYSLLTLILGKDPINGASVERNSTNLIRGILSLVPGGDNIFNNLQQSGAIDKAFNWFNSQIAKLNLTGETIKGLFKKAWDSLGMSDIISPGGAFDKIKNIFTQPIGRIKNFAVVASTKVSEFVWEGVMGAGGAKVMAIIKNAGGAFNNILKDPIAFCGNLVGAIRGGFQQFSGNIATHLKNGLTGWLFGALAGAGLTLPAQFDFKGIVSIVLQVVGATYEKLRGKLVKKIGENRVGRLEKTFDFLKGIVTGGLGVAWQKIAEFTGNLQEMVMGGIKEWVKNSIITAAITKLISMFNPAGAIVQAVMTIYNSVMFFIERGAQIAALGEAVFSSIGNIAAGNIGAAANYVELSMGRTLPVVISFLARLIGLGGVSGQILGAIKRVQGKVEDAIGKVVDFVVEKSKSLLGKGEGQNGQLSVSAPQGQLNQQELMSDFQVQVSFSMSGEGHRLIAMGKKGKLEILIASNPELFIPALKAALKEVNNSKRPDKNKCQEELGKAWKKVTEIAYDMEINKAKILKGVGNNYNSEQEATKQYVKSRLAEIANDLELFAKTAHIKSLDDFYKTPPSERYIPGYPSQEEVGKFIRQKLYDKLGWDNIRDQVEVQEKQKLIQKVRGVQKIGDQGAWRQLIQTGLVEPKATMNNYDPNKVKYHVDHIEPLAKRWCDKGYDSDDSQRLHELTERKNLRLVTARYNTSKGSGGIKYLPYVGPNFISQFAEGGINGSLKVHGQPFLDASGQPLV